MLIALSILIAGILIRPQKLVAEDVVPIELLPKEYTKAELIQKVYKYAEIHKNNPKKIISTINCENTAWDVDLQSGLKYKPGNRWKQPAGSLEKSYGLAQIHLPDHPEISYKEAIDPDFAISYMAEHLGRDVTWSCHKKNP
jgi:hypothetical protein